MIPSHLRRKKPAHVAEFDGHPVGFYPITAPMLLELLEATDVVDALASLLGGAGVDQAGRALLKAISARGELVATLVLDSMQDEPWVARPVTAEAARAFLAEVDGPTLVEMLACVVKANREGWGPLVARLLEDLTHGARALTSSLGSSSGGGTSS